MTPSSPQAAPSGAAASTGSNASVTDELRAIDTSVLDQLLEMRQEEVRIEEYRQRADKMKDAVDPLVWQRVVTDYKTRLATLEAQAKPLKAQARKEYAKLRVLLDRITGEQKAAQVSKAELDFRHAVGELDDAELAERLAGPVGIIARCDDELTSVGELKGRFVDAFGAEIELEEPVPSPSKPASPAASAKPAAPPPEAAPAPPLPAAPATSPVPAFSGQTPAAPMEASEATAFVMIEELHSADATVIGLSVNVTQPLPSSAGTMAPDPAATMLHTPAAPVVPNPSDEHTFLLPPAALLIGPDEPSPQEYRLAAVNYLGRSDDNHLQLARPGVSRRHAVIMAANGGFVIQDLGSQNGVFVNGERISEHALKDGEQVVIGDRTMVYRSPWPQQGRRGGARGTKA